MVSSWYHSFPTSIFGGRILRLISLIFQDPKDDVVESYCHSMVEPHPLTIPILEQAGFGEIEKLRHLKMDHALVISLVERWRPETHTFHFPTDECIIALQDISLQLDLKVDGQPIVLGGNVWHSSGWCTSKRWITHWFISKTKMA